MCNNFCTLQFLLYRRQFKLSLIAKVTDKKILWYLDLLPIINHVECIKKCVQMADLNMKLISGYLLVGMLWGCTNPIIKHAQSNLEPSSCVPGERNSQDLKDKPQPSRSQHVFQSVKRLFLEPRVFLPYIVNQMGSLVYYYVLSQEPINRANPICNSLTFVITAVTGYWLFDERFQNPIVTCAGILMVLVGIYICATN